MPRYFIPEKIPDDREKIMLEADDSHHVKNVLRLNINDRVEVCDRGGTDYVTIIAGFTGGRAELVILDRQPGRNEPPYRAVLYQGLAKGDKMDAIIQKSVELGVQRIVPVSCRRSVARWNRESAAKKIERWNKIAQAAAGQCGRNLVPIVTPCLDFDTAVAEAAKADIRLIPWEGERACSLRQWLDGQKTDNQPQISIFIGPEGGFAPDEIETASRADIKAVSLGRRILRTETAGPAVLAMLIYRFSDF